VCKLLSKKDMTAYLYLHLNRYISQLSNASSPSAGLVSKFPYTERYVLQDFERGLYGDVHFYDYKNNGLHVEHYPKARFVSGKYHCTVLVTSSTAHLHFFCFKKIVQNMEHSPCLVLETGRRSLRATIGTLGQSFLCIATTMAMDSRRCSSKSR